MRNAGLEEAQAGIKIAGRNIKNLRYADNTTLMAESEEELKSLLMTRRTFVGQVMSLLFNMLSRLVMEKAMAPYSSTLAWKIPWTEEPGGCCSKPWRLRQVCWLLGGERRGGAMYLETFY